MIGDQESFKGSNESYLKMPLKFPTIYTRLHNRIRIFFISAKCLDRLNAKNA